VHDSLLFLANFLTLLTILAGIISIGFYFRFFLLGFNESNGVLVLDNFVDWDDLIDNFGLDNLGLCIYLKKLPRFGVVQSLFFFSFLGRRPLFFWKVGYVFKFAELLFSSRRLRIVSLREVD
jgi:hypothetical protein